MHRAPKYSNGGRADCQRDVKMPGPAPVLIRRERRKLGVLTTPLSKGSRRCHYFGARKYSAITFFVSSSTATVSPPAPFAAATLAFIPM